MFILEDECNTYSRAIQLLSMSTDSVRDIIAMYQKENNANEGWFVRVISEITAQKAGYIKIFLTEEDEIDVEFTPIEEFNEPNVLEAVNGYVDTLQELWSTDEPLEIDSGSDSTPLLYLLQHRIFSKLANPLKSESKTLSNILLMETTDLTHLYRMVTMYGDNMFLFVGNHVEIKFVIIPYLDAKSEVQLNLENFSIKFKRTHTFIDLSVTCSVADVVSKRFVDAITEQLTENVNFRLIEQTLREMEELRENELQRIEKDIIQSKESKDVPKE